MKYCNFCGNQLYDDAKFCSKCGKKAHKVYGMKAESESSAHTAGAQSRAYNESAAHTAGAQSERAEQSYFYEAPRTDYNLHDLDKHRELVRTLSSRLRTNAILWFIIAGIQIVIGMFGTIVPLIVGVLNIISAVNDLKMSKSILNDQRGIVAANESMTSPIITLVYNAVVGAVIGIGGSLYYMFAIRKYVMDNKESFLAMEENPINL